MRPSLLTFALAALAALTATGCSGGDPIDPAATLPGAWEVQSVASRTFLTVSTDQTIRPAHLAGSGGLVLTGDVSATLRYFLGGTPTGAAFVADAPLFGVGSEPTRVVRFNGATPPTITLVLVDPGGASATTLTLVSFDGAAPFTRTATYVEAHNARFALAADPTFEVTVTGRLTFATQQLTANQEAAIISTTTPRADADVLTRTFGEGAAYTQRNGDLSTVTGTWADLGGGQVRTVVGATTTTYDYGISGSTLTLTQGAAPGCDSECQLEISAFYGVQQGTVVALRTEEVETLARGAEAPARPSAPPASFGLESPAPRTAARPAGAGPAGAGPAGAGLPADPFSFD